MAQNMTEEFFGPGVQERRFLEIGIEGGAFLRVPLTLETAARLISQGTVYECGDGHDLHLTPDYEWDLVDVEAIVVAISELAS